tara:strand:- start:734 stop:1927 length:1194 start_codon:yes stop_codon:yes gene_type:complete
MRKKYNLSFKLNDIVLKEEGKLKIHSKNIESKFVCYWLGTCNGYGVNNDDLKNIGLGGLLNLKSTMIQDKSFYRFPDLSLPRQKVDLLKDKYNIKVTRKMDAADYKVISKRYLNKLFTVSWYPDYNKSLVYEFMKKLKELDFLSECALNSFRLILEDTPPDAMFRVDMNTYSWNNGRNQLSTSDQADQTAFLEKLENLKAEFFTDGTHSILIGEDTSAARKNDVTMFNSIIGQNNVILDETLIEIIDEGLAVLDNTQYSDIEKMITCESIDDRSIALEMLANCNVNKSFDVVSGLYWWHYDWMKNTNNWNTVNVKALRNQMKTYEGGHSTQNIWSFNNYLKYLAEDGKMTKFAVDETREKLHSTLLNSFIGPSSEMFKVDLDNLKISDKYKTNVIDE